MSDPADRVPLDSLTVLSLPDPWLLEEVAAEAPDFRCVLWDLVGEPQECARHEVDIAVASYDSNRWRKDPSVLRDVSLLQLQSTGYDGVPELLGEGTALAAAGWVHAAGTAEIALGLIIAAQRELGEILPRTDILVLALPLTASTVGLVDREMLSRLPDDALVVNVGRGPVVDTAALTSEVCAGRLRCALDVVDPEPLPGEHPLMGAAGSIVLPHVGGSNASYRPRMRRLVLEQLERLRQARSPQFLVQPGRLMI